MIAHWCPVCKKRVINLDKAEYSPKTRKFYHKSCYKKYATREVSSYFRSKGLTKKKREALGRKALGL